MNTSQTYLSSKHICDVKVIFAAIGIAVTLNLAGCNLTPVLHLDPEQVYRIDNMQTELTRLRSTVKATKHELNALQVTLSEAKYQQEIIEKRSLKSAQDIVKINSTLNGQTVLFDALHSDIQRLDTAHFKQTEHFVGLFRALYGNPLIVCPVPEQSPKQQGTDQPKVAALLDCVSPECIPEVENCFQDASKEKESTCLVKVRYEKE